MTPLVTIVDRERELIDSKELYVNQADSRQRTFNHARHWVFNHSEYHPDSAFTSDKAIPMLPGDLDTVQFCSQQTELLKQATEVPSGRSELTDLPHHVEEPGAREALERRVRYSKALETEAVDIRRPLVGIERVREAIAGNKDSTWPPRNAKRLAEPRPSWAAHEMGIHEMRQDIAIKPAPSLPGTATSVEAIKQQLFRAAHALSIVCRTLAISCERQGAAGARCPSEARAGARLLHRLVRRRRTPQNQHGASPPRPRQIVRLILPTIVTHTMMEGVARRSHSSIGQAWLRRPLNQSGTATRATRNWNAGVAKLSVDQCRLPGGTDHSSTSACRERRLAQPP